MKELSLVVPLTLAIAEGATSPAPAAAGAIVWSSTTSTLMQWDGSKWDSIRSLPIGVSTQSVTSYTTVYGDRSSLIVFTATTAIGVTIPLNSSVPYSIGTQISFAQDNTGQITLGGSATLRTSLTLKTRVRYAVITATKVATDTWYITGDLAIT